MLTINTLSGAIVNLVALQLRTCGIGRGAQLDSLEANKTASDTGKSTRFYNFNAREIQCSRNLKGQ